jgi:hypothetical protein
MNGWLLLAMVIDAPGPGWSDEMSDVLDRAIKRSRNAERNNLINVARSSRWEGSPSTISGPYQPPRGLLSAQEVMRRNAAAVTIAKRNDSSAAKPSLANGSRFPRPRLMSSGRWLALFRHDGRSYRGWFDTAEEAIAWVREIKGAV